MATLKARIDQLEAFVPSGAVNYCLVVHRDDCGKDREEAIAEYVARYGIPPLHFTDVMLISPGESSKCGCPTKEERGESCGI
jgi:hypothetical protein